MCASTIDCIKLAEVMFPCQETTSGWVRGDLCPAIPDPGGEYNRTPLNTTAEAPHYVSWRYYYDQSKNLGTMRNNVFLCRINLKKKLKKHLFYTNFFFVFPKLTRLFV